MRSKAFALLALIFVWPNSSPAQCKKYGVVNPVWDQSTGAPGTISAFLEHTFVRSENTDAKWILMDFGGSFIPLKDVTYPKTSAPGGRPDYYETVIVTPATAPLLNHEYSLYAENFRFDDCPKAQQTVTPASVQTVRPKKGIVAYSPSTSRADSDFYFSPTIDGASGTKASYTADLKFQFRYGLVGPLFGLQDSPSKGRRYIYQPGVNFVPGMDFKASSNPKEDGDSVAFQLPIEIVTPTSPRRFSALSRVLPSLISKPAFVLESDKKFHDINAIFSNTEYLVLRGFGETVQLIPEPFIGVETGSNLKAQEAGTYPAAILRGVFGLHVGFVVLRLSKTKPLTKPLFSIESDYILRVLLNPEPVYTQNSKGNLVLMSVGTQPRNHVATKISYDLTSYVALSLGYEYGELPPVYTKVDNKYTFGIVFKGQLMKPPAAPK